MTMINSIKGYRIKKLNKYQDGEAIRAEDVCGCRVMCCCCILLTWSHVQKNTVQMANTVIQLIRYHQHREFFFFYFFY